MSRIPDDELERIKQEIDLAALVRSRGIELNKHGSKDLVGLSPFREEKTASFIVTPAKNLWHCMSSGKGGSVIDFIIEYDGVSFRHAVELLRNGSASKLMNGSTPSKKSTVPKLEAPVSFDADDQTLFAQVLDYYHERLKQTPSALNYLKSRGITAEAIDCFKLGFADRTLGLRLPHKNRVNGSEIRTRLQKIGLYRESGHEHFNGCIVFAIKDESGNVTEIYGRKANNKQKNGIYHLYLPGPHRGLFNFDAVKSPDIILTESVIDALTFWCNGHRNVTCIYGTEGFNQEHENAFIRNKTKKVYLAYDRDKAGDRAAQRDAERLSAFGIDCYRVQFPHNQDANEYALKVTPANKSLQVLLNAAQPILYSTKILAANVSSSDAAKEKTVASEPPVKPDIGVKLTQLGEDYIIEIGDRFYRIRGLQKNTSFEVLKVNLRLMHCEDYYLDTLDLYRAKERLHFINSAASETNLKPELLKRDLGKVLLQLEAVQEQRIKAELEPKNPEVEISEEDQGHALELLKDPDLLSRILADFEQCGIVGESTNKLTGYLAAVSRKLDKPLAIIIQSTSAAGKTSLMDAVLSMMPEEERIKYSAMTGQSLYYLGETNLKHKILAIVEEEGAEKASYALKLLQSEGELTIASTGKDENGRMKTEEYHVEGPVMIFLTSTSIDIDEELLNRCMLLSVDESREQTQAIHQLQRQAETFEGLKRKVERERILTVHKNAQRLLKAYHVVNPFAPKLTFLSDRTRTRRDHLKYLTLIRTITLLHQYQRPIKERDNLKYIEVTLQDIEAANQIAHEVLGRSLDELPPQTRSLLTKLKGMVEKRCQVEGLETDQCLFTRRHVRDFTGWSHTQLKVHLDRLEEFEYILSHRGMRGSSYEYELLFDGKLESSKPQLVGLIETKNLNYDSKFAGVNGKFTPRKRGQNAPFAGSSLAADSAKTNGSEQKFTENDQNAQGTEKLVTIVTQSQGEAESED